MADYIKMIYDKLSNHPDSNYQNRTFFECIAIDRPSYIKFQCTDSSHIFEVILDEKLLSAEHPNIKMEKLFPKYQVEVWMKHDAGAWTRMLTGLVMKVERFTAGRFRKKFIRISGVDWFSGIFKKRVLRNFSFMGDRMPGESGLGVRTKADDVFREMITYVNNKGATGCLATIDTYMDAANSTDWPYIARDFSNRTAFDAMRGLAKEVGMDFCSDPTKIVHVQGWMNNNAGNYTDDDIASLNYTESVEPQADNIYTGPGTLRVFPVERIDKWMETDMWNLGVPAYSTVTKNEAGPDGTSTIRFTWNTFNPGLTGYAKLFGLKPSAGEFPLVFSATGVGDNADVETEAKMVRFFMQAQKPNGDPITNDEILGRKFKVYLAGESYRTYISRELSFDETATADGGPLTKWYDLSLVGKGTSGSDFPDIGSSTAPLKIQHIDFFFKKTSEEAFLLDIGQVHLVYEATQEDTATPGTGLPLFEGIDIDPTNITGVDELTMAQRTAAMIRPNDFIARMELHNPDIGWGSTKFPGSYIQLQSDSLEVPDVAAATADPTTYKKLRVEQVEQFFKNHRLVTTLRCENVPFQANHAQESKTTNLLDTLLSYDSTDANGNVAS